MLTNYQHTSILTHIFADASAKLKHINVSSVRTCPQALIPYYKHGKFFQQISISLSKWFKTHQTTWQRMYNFDDLTPYCFLLLLNKAEQLNHWHWVYLYFGQQVLYSVCFRLPAHNIYSISRYLFTTSEYCISAVQVAAIWALDCCFHYWYSTVSQIDKLLYLDFFFSSDAMKLLAEKQG